MKTRSTITKVIGVLLLAALTLMGSISAAAAGCTTLTTTVPSVFSFTLEIEGNGTVTVNSVDYTESQMLEIQRNAAVTIQVQPDSSYYTESATYNGKDITPQLKAGKIILPALEKDSQMQISFTAKATGPQTGDIYFDAAVTAGIAMVLSLLCITMLLANRKKKHSN